MTRIAWTSEIARAVWQPRIARVTRMRERLEVESVRRGLRRCAMPIVPAYRWFELLRELSPDYAVLPLQNIAATGGYQGFSAAAWTPGKPLAIRLAVGPNGDAERLRDVCMAHDDAAVGELLGFPRCCIDAYLRVCVEGGATDPTFAASAGRTELDAAWQTNLLLRAIGVRAVPYLPCSFTCDATVTRADALAALAREIGFAQEMTWTEEMLSWPCEVSALHGITEVRTPILKVLFPGDAAPKKRVVRLRGDRYPAEGARGVAFPYVRGAAAGEARWIHEDNGFASVAAMTAAHAPLVALAAKSLRECAGPLLDLGCGNALLLVRIRGTSELRLYGIDADGGRVARARELAAGSGGAFAEGDLLAAAGIWNSEPRFGLVLVSAARIREAAAARRDELARLFADRAARVLLYDYDRRDIGDAADGCGLRPLPGLSAGGAAVCVTA